MFSGTLAPTSQTASYHNHKTAMKIVHHQEYLNY